MDVHPPKYGTIGFDPWPYGKTLNINDVWIPLYMYLTSGHALCITTRCRASRMPWFQVYKMGRGGGLVRFPGNTGEPKIQTKNPSFTCLPQVYLFSGPKQRVIL